MNKQEDHIFGSQGNASRGGPQIIPRPYDFELGGSPPWGEIAESERNANLQRLRELLRADDAGGETAADPSRDPSAPSIPEELAQGTWRKSAVLVPLYEDKGELHVILTRRAAHLRSHSREVSFPGGGQEEADSSLWETALRETQEEIALDAELVERIGQLPTFRTVGSKSLVHPFVSVIRGGRPEGLIPDPSEVEHILYIPMSELLQDDVFYEERWKISAIGTVTVNFFELYGDTVWGATAAMLRQLLALATGTETLTHHFWEQDR